MGTRAPAHPPRHLAHHLLIGAKHKNNNPERSCKGAQPCLLSRITDSSHTTHRSDGGHEGSLHGPGEAPYPEGPVGIRVGRRPGLLSQPQQAPLTLRGIPGAKKEEGTMSPERSTCPHSGITGQGREGACTLSIIVTGRASREQARVLVPLSGLEMSNRANALCHLNYPSPAR